MRNKKKARQCKNTKKVVKYDLTNNADDEARNQKEMAIKKDYKEEDKNDSFDGEDGTTKEYKHVKDDFSDDESNTKAKDMQNNTQSDEVQKENENNVLTKRKKKQEIECDHENAILDEQNVKKQDNTVNAIEDDEDNNVKSIKMQSQKKENTAVKHAIAEMVAKKRGTKSKKTSKRRIYKKKQTVSIKDLNLMNGSENDPNAIDDVTNDPSVMKISSGEGNVEQEPVIDAIQDNASIEEKIQKKRGRKKKEVVNETVNTESSEKEESVANENEQVIETAAEEELKNESLSEEKPILKKRGRGKKILIEAKRRGRKKKVIIENGEDEKKSEEVYIERRGRKKKVVIQNSTDIVKERRGRKKKVTIEIDNKRIVSKKDKINYFLSKDQFQILYPENRPFKNKKHAIECLLPYHIFENDIYEDAQFYASINKGFEGIVDYNADNNLIDKQTGSSKSDEHVSEDKNTSAEMNDTELDENTLNRKMNDLIQKYKQIKRKYFENILNEENIVLDILKTEELKYFVFRAQKKAENESVCGYKNYKISLKYENPDDNRIRILLDDDYIKYAKK